MMQTDLPSGPLMSAAILALQALLNPTGHGHGTYSRCLPVAWPGRQGKLPCAAAGSSSFLQVQMVNIDVNATGL